VLLFGAGVRAANEILAVTYHIHTRNSISFNSETLAAQEIQSAGSIWSFVEKATQPQTGVIEF